MDIWLKAFIAFLVISAFGFGSYNIVKNVKIQNYYDDRNGLCKSITNELENSFLQNSSANVSAVYCYYAPYAAPDGLGNYTETLCVCDYRVRGSDNVYTMQILDIKTTSTPAIKVNMRGLN